MGTSYQNIRVNKDSKQKVKSLAQRHGRTETAYVNQMIHFVYQSGMDVFTEMAPNVPDLIKNLDKRIVSFLKKREQDFFVPMNNSFREMIRLHQQTFQMLDVLQPGTIGLDSNVRTSSEKQEKPSFKIPENEGLEIPDTDAKIQEEPGHGSDVKNIRHKEPISDTEKSTFLGQIERLKKERNLYEQELKYLLGNLKPSRSITGPKFTCDLPQKEIDRIKVLIDGH